VKLPPLMAAVLRYTEPAASRAVHLEGILPMGDRPRKAMNTAPDAQLSSSTGTLFRPEQVTEQYRWSSAESVSGQPYAGVAYNCRGDDATGDSRYWCPCFAKIGGVDTFTEQYACCSYSTTNLATRCKCTGTNPCAAYS
jgi:hypothetical protein